MKEAEIQIGCTYRVSETQGGGTITIKNRTDLSAAFDLYMSGDLLPIVLDADELVRLGMEKDENKDVYTIRINGDYTLELSCNGFSNHDDGEYWITITGYYQKVTLNNRYVHQTQQLFQALTGENLPYNEK